MSRARLPLVCLAIAVLAMPAYSGSANSASASLSIGVTVVRSCSVETPPTSNGAAVEVNVECRKGAADSVSVGVTGSSESTVRKIAPGPNRFSITPQASVTNANGILTIAIEF